MPKFEFVDRVKWLADDAKTLGEAATRLEGYAKLLREMEEDGLQLNDSIDNGYIFLYTEDEVLANKYRFEKVEDDEDVDVDGEAEEREP